jgi:hypothetical protein
VYSPPVAQRGVLALARAAMAVVAAVAIVAQLVELAGLGILDPVNFFSYFTIQSNLIGIVVLAAGAARWREPRSGTFDRVRGAAVVYLTVTFVVYGLLLSGIEVDTSVPWVNTIVHQVMPIAVMLDWIVDPPRARIGLRDALVWLVYPLGWLGYTLIRGALVGWYPYPFLDPSNGGYGTVAIYVVAIFVFGFLLCLAVAGIGSVLGGRGGRDVAADRQSSSA